MNTKSFCSQVLPRQASKLRRTLIFLASLTGCFFAQIPAAANDAPAWVHAQVSAAVPMHDDKTDAVEMYSERIVIVQSADKIKTQVREVYKILRPGGRDLGTVVIPFDSLTKITNLHAWCVPAQGKDYEVKEKDGAEVAMPAVQGSELISDVRAKLVHIPAADPGNVIGYEYEQENPRFVLKDICYSQRSYPPREPHSPLQPPAGWEYKASWLNHAEVAPTQAGTSQWQWGVTGIAAVKDELEMPPYRGISGQM